MKELIWGKSTIRLYGCSAFNFKYGKLSSYTNVRAIGFYALYSLVNPHVDGRIILRWIFRKWDVGTWTGSSWLRTGTCDGDM
jgi:hypothetical protein